jgi:hypothetical protein
VLYIPQEHDMQRQVNKQEHSKKHIAPTKPYAFRHEASNELSNEQEGEENQKRDVANRHATETRQKNLDGETIWDERIEQKHKKDKIENCGFSRH